VPSSLSTVKKKKGKYTSTSGTEKCRSTLPAKSSYAERKKDGGEKLLAWREEKSGPNTSFLFIQGKRKVCTFRTKKEANGERLPTTPTVLFLGGKKG